MNFHDLGVLTRRFLSVSPRGIRCVFVMAQIRVYYRKCNAGKEERQSCGAATSWLAARWPAKGTESFSQEDIVWRNLCTELGGEIVGVTQTETGSSYQAAQLLQRLPRHISPCTSFQSGNLNNGPSWPPSTSDEWKGRTSTPAVRLQPCTSPWGACANLMQLVGREDAVWLLDLNSSALFNQIPKALEYNGCFSRVCPICSWKETPVLLQERHMAICTARRMEYFSLGERMWNQNGRFKRDLTGKILGSLRITAASEFWCCWSEGGAFEEQMTNVWITNPSLRRA